MVVPQCVFVELPRSPWSALTGILLFLGAMGAPQGRADEERPPADVLDLSIEELLELDVSSVSRRDESLRTAPAAVFVITQQDIERSGARRIPDLLRMVPGVHVAQMDASKWAVTARGLNGRFARHLLVLMDGRTVYSPLFSGTFWELQGTLLHDIDRIEVIRGPGGTMWGANAVNAVINIITKSAAETQGHHAEVGVGTEERLFGSYRYGGKIGENIFYRLYAKGFERDASGGDEPAYDNWHRGRGGFRIDWMPDTQDTLTLQGGWYGAETGQSFNGQSEDVTGRGGHLLARWERKLAPNHGFALQSYYTYSNRSEEIMAEERHTVDVDFQHRLRINAVHELMWGAGFRVTSDNLRDSQHIQVVDDDQTDHLYSWFVQDEITLKPDRLSLTLGTKVERNDYTGVEVQPSVRCIASPSDRQSVWAAVSRAVRTPARLERNSTVRTTINGWNANIVSDDSFDSEVLWAYELGHRVRLADRTSVDTAVFFHDYDEYQSVNIVAVPPPAFDGHVGNGVYGEIYGVETSVRFQATDWWRLAGAYSYTRVFLHVEEGVNDITTEGLFESDQPRHQASLRSMMDLTKRLHLDAWLRFVDDIKTPEADHRFDEIVELDLRIRWQVSKSLHLELVGRNLLDQTHGEYGPSVLYRVDTTEVERSAYAQLTCTF